VIISHKYNFIFIKTSKTASTSIEIALSRFCGDQDIITPIHPIDEEIRRKLGYRGPQNYTAPLHDNHIKDVSNLRKGKRKHYFYSHISASEIKGKIGQEIWNSYFKFCFERNPYERFISLYYWRNQQREPQPPISEVLVPDIAFRLKARGIELYTINGELAVDKVCLYENMDEELENIRVRLGIPEKIEVPKAKSSFRKDKRSYREILTSEQMENIRELFKKEMSLFGYE
jgi:hypothetical protein